MLDRFLRWLLPVLYRETAECLYCGSTVSKTRMYQYPEYGWFCNEREFHEYWLDTQL